MEKRNKRIPTVGCDFGRLGALLGESWGGLGPSWASWGDLGATFWTVHFRIVFFIDFGRQKGAQREPFWEPKSTQNGTRNESKFKTIFKHEKIALQDRLGALLGRMWAVLDPRNRSLPWGLAFWQDKLSKRVWDPTWSNLGAKRAENDPKMEPQNDPKTRPK